MKRVLSVVVLCISLLLGLFFVAHAQVRVLGDVTAKDYKVEVYGDLIPGSDGRLSSAMMQGKGQYYLASENILVTSEKVTEISNETLAIQITGKTKVFKLTKTTRICDGSKSLKPNDIKKGDMVTITSKVDQQTALSVRKGPMILGALPPNVLKTYKCEQ